MYKEKLNPILQDIENKKIEIAGGSVVAIILSITNSLIKYTCNLTKDKKNYENVRKEVLEIISEVNNLKEETTKAIDMDKQLVEEMLTLYKKRKEEPEKYEQVVKKSAEFCIGITQKALQTLKLAIKISKIGNKMLVSDYNICILYSFTSVKASIENVKINVEAIKDEEYKNKIIEQYKNLYAEAKNIYKLKD